MKRVSAHGAAPHEQSHGEWPLNASSPNERQPIAGALMLAGGIVVMLATLLTRTWGIHVDEILYAGFADHEPLGDARVVGNQFLIYLFNYALYHVGRWTFPRFALLTLPVFYAVVTVLAIWRLAGAGTAAGARAGADPSDSWQRRWAFALLLISPFVLFNATQLMLETALVPLLAGVLASALNRSPRRAAVLGALAAACALTKATSLPALALLTVALWPTLGTGVWPIVAGGLAGTVVNRIVLTALHARSAEYGGVAQLVASVTDPSLDRVLGFLGVWGFFAGLPALGAVWSWRQHRDAPSRAFLAAALLSAPAALIVQLSTNPALPFPRYAYPVIWVGLAAGCLACARSQSRWLAPVVLAFQLPLATALWPGVFSTMTLWPSTVVLEAFQNGGTILSGTPVHGWVAMSGEAREQLCVFMPRSSPGALQAEPWFSQVAKEVTFFDANQYSEFQQCSGAKVVFDRRFDVNPCELDPCPPSRYRIRSCLPQHIGFYSPRLGDVQTRVCLP